MAARRWSVTVDGMTHEVELRRSWNGALTAVVDGTAAGLGAVRRGMRYPLRIGGRVATVIALSYGRSTSFDLVIDGRSASNGGQPRPPLGPASMTVSYSILFVLCLLLVIGVGVFGAVPEIRLSMNGQQTAGIVTDRYTTSGRSSTSYHLRYAFVTADGQRVAATGLVDQQLYSRSAPGATITVLYAPDDPSVQRPAAYDEDWAIVGLMVMFGVCSVVMAVFAVSALRKRALAKALASGELASTNAVVERISPDRTNGLATIRYRYTADDGVDRLGKSDPLYREEAAGYTVGASARIAYDPQRPGRSLWLGVSDPTKTVWVTGP